MLLFLLGIAILVAGYFTYGKFVEKVIKPTDNPTPAVSMEDGVDYVPMSIMQNSLVQLLNIAGTGPITGPIIGILWGPIVFLIIPIGNIIAGATHDYIAGMLSLRENGAQVPTIVRKYLGKITFHIFNVFVVLLMILVGVVFISIPADILIFNIWGSEYSTFANIGDFFTSPAMLIYIAIFAYYIIATLLPVDKVIGKIYPVFGVMLILMAVGVFFGLFYKDGWMDALNAFTDKKLFANHHPSNLPFIPLFFTTVACGIVSGFHASQAPIIARTIKTEHEGRFTFYGMMVLEGIIAMIWAAGGIIGREVYDLSNTTEIMSTLAQNSLPWVFGSLAVGGLIILPLTSGDTALRSGRMIIADYLKFDQKAIKNRLLIALPMFAVVFALLLFRIQSADGFNTMWRYFAWMNQTTAVFVFFAATVYLYKQFAGKLFYLITLVPGTFYCYVVVSYFLGGNFRNNTTQGDSADIGISLGYDSGVAYILAGVITAGLVALVMYRAAKCEVETTE